MLNVFQVRTYCSLVKTDSWTERQVPDPESTWEAKGYS